MSSKINLQTCEYARKSSIFQDNQLISIEKLNITGGTLKGELRIEDNYLYLIASNAYSFLMKTDKSGKVVFYNHDFVPIMSLDYTGNLIVKGEIVSNRTPI